MFQGVPIVGSEINLIFKNISPGAVFIDAGAGIGEYSLNVGKKVPGSIVHCFEPGLESWQCVNNSIRRNGLSANVTCHKLGLSDAEGTFGIASVDDGAFVIKSDLVADLSKFQASEFIQTTTLDLFVGKHGIQKLDFVKVDIEGAELFMLKGSEASLKNFKPHLQLELVDWCAVRLGYDVADVFEYLRSLNYFCRCAVDEQSLVHAIAPGESVDEMMAKGYNFFFAHNSRHFAV